MNIINAVLHGFSQALFQENIIFGILIAVGFLIASPIALILALLGNVSSIISSNLLGAPKNLIETGFYSFNGVLIGAMVSFYVKQLSHALVVTIIASILATIIFHLLFRNHIPPFTFPFVLMSWVLVILLKFLKLG